METNPETLDTKQVMGKLDICRTTLEKWVRNDIFPPAVRIGRVRRWTQTQVDLFLTNNKSH